MRIYIDTSVVGGFYDKEFSTSSKALFGKVKKNEVVLVVSELLQAELLRAPERVRDHLNRYPKTQIELVELTEKQNFLLINTLRNRLLA